MKNPADCWTAAYPDYPFGNLPLDIQEIVTAAYWLGAAEAALSAISIRVWRSMARAIWSV